VRDLNVNSIRDINIPDGQDIQDLQKKCPDFVPIFDYLEVGQLPADDKAARKLIWSQNNLL